MPRLLGGRDHLLKYFTERCGDFFVEPLKLIRPRVIITRVVYVLQLIASRSESLAEWPTDRSFSDIDRIGLLHFDVGFKGYRRRIHIVSLTHPSSHSPNVRHRRYRLTQGLTAEVAMLRCNHC